MFNMTVLDEIHIDIQRLFDLRYSIQEAVNVQLYQILDNNGSTVRVIKK